jgi:hypothetical protein
MDVGNIVDVSELHAACIFMIKDCGVLELHGMYMIFF